MSVGMELILRGVVKKIGNTLYVRIPADQADLLGIKEGSPLLMSKEGRTFSIEFPGEGEEEKKPGTF